MKTQTDKYLVINSMPIYARKGKRKLGESFDSTTICAKHLVTGQVKKDIEKETDIVL